MHLPTPYLAYFNSGSWLQFLIIGIIAGLLLDLCLRGRSYGFLANSLLGFAGAILGSFIWDKLLSKHIAIDLGTVTIRFDMVLVALLGAVLLLLIINLVNRYKKK